MLHRREVVNQLLRARAAKLAVVSGLGSSTWDIANAGDHAKNFGFIGAMGQAAPFALGVAMAKPDHRVLLITGDGEMLMGLGALATIANQAPTNLAVAVLDNESYVETGKQPTATAGATDLEVVANGCGFASAFTVTNEDQLDGWRESMLEGPGPVFSVVKVVVESLPLVFPHSFDGATSMNRFRGALTVE
ncbi:MAG: thiamine pyrophosphate-dependent enzyme [Pseudomonadota bacterium]